MNSSDPAPGALGWLLVLESATERGGVALLRAGQLVEAIDLAPGLRHGRDLLPAAERLLKNWGVRTTELAALAVSGGPGSYTGLRVGAMAGKALAWAGGQPLLGVSSLASLALGLAALTPVAPGEEVVALLPSRRDEVYLGHYRFSAHPPFPVEASPSRALSPEEARDFIASRVSRGVVHLAGSGFTAFPAVFPAPPPLLLYPPAGATGLLAWRQFLQGEYADPLAFQPLYLSRDPGGGWSPDKLIISRPD
ncbi:MAG: tRNA (adenosine(37)-N6)-threonylcarbamoyltransferase complex dimerization subunit type 1 TsaB [Planctomycetota bacterium]|nr:tRNA (adenosine(37)-N6)-threonylcarbamoyltransferase complex dimerization subunit type 1 TsaB [Planctomycetota bacterium]